MNDIRRAVIVAEALCRTEIEIHPQPLVDAVAVSHPGVMISEYDQNHRLVQRIQLVCQLRHILPRVGDPGEIIAKDIVFRFRIPCIHNGL